MEDLGFWKEEQVVEKESSLNVRRAPFVRRREHGKKVVKILAGGKILEVREDPEDQTAAWK